MADVEQTTAQSRDRLSGAAVGAALVAMGTLYCNTPDYHGLILIALALLATFVTDFRLPKHLLLLWPLRVLLFSVVIVTGAHSKARGAYWLFDPEYTNVFGYLCAAEMVVQAWQKRAGEAPRGEMLMLSALIMATATNTYERRYIQFLTPAYAMCLAISFRDFRRFNGERERERRRWSARRRWAAVAVALLIGAATAEGLRLYGENITIYPLTGLFKRMRSSMPVAISSSSRLRMAYNIQPSALRILRVEGKWGGGHLRGMSLDTYVNETWGPGLAERQFEPVGPEHLKSRAEGRRLRIERLVDDLNLLYVPLDAMGVVPAQGSETEWDRGSDRIIRSVVEDGSQYRYEVVLGLPDHQGPICAPLSEEQRRLCLAVPDEIDPRVRELAKQIAGSHEAKGRVMAVMEYLEANHKYSLWAEPGDGSGDMVCDFLLNKKSGHCQFFASSAVILLRCMGVPARFITGYYVHETTGEGEMVARQRDAHAWAECWLDGVGWVTVDATPGSGRPDQAFTGIGLWRKVQEKLQDWWAALRQWVLGMDWKRAMVLCGGCIVLFMVGRWIWEWWSRRPRKMVVGRCIYPEGDLAAVARGFERLLRRCGIRCDGVRTWRESLQAAIRDRGGELAALNTRELQAFIEAYEQMRFGGRADGDAAERLQERLKKLEVKRRVR